jgi:hypothetical protein
MHLHPHSTVHAHTHTHSWLSMNHLTALSMYIHTHMAIKALPQSTVHAYTHTFVYPCTATALCTHIHTHICYPCIYRKHCVLRTYTKTLANHALQDNPHANTCTHPQACTQTTITHTPSHSCKYIHTYGFPCTTRQPLCKTQTLNTHTCIDNLNGYPCIKPHSNVHDIHKHMYTALLTSTLCTHY